jgi:rhodanese-related sulfurtransferase
MIRLLTLISGLLLLPGLLCAGDYFQTISMDEVARVMNRPGVALLDLNVPELWEKYHLPGAVHVDSADIARFLPADKGATLIFYCAGPLCSASGMAANESVLLGYRRVYVMNDGIFGWVRSGYPALPAAAVHKDRVK